MNTVTASRTGPYGSTVPHYYHNVDRYCTASSLPITLTAAAKIAPDCKRSVGKPVQLTSAILSEYRERAHPPACREGRA